MRFEVNVECTPEEARQFFGLPDLMPMQKDLMDMLSRRLSENIQTMEPDKLAKTWLPAMFQGWSDMQQNFWNQMGDMGGKVSKNMMGGMGDLGGMMGGNPFSAAKKSSTEETKSASKRKR